MYQLGGLESFPSLFLLLASSKTPVSPSPRHHSSRTFPAVFHCSWPGVTKDQTKRHENNNCFRVSMHVFFNTFQLLKSVQKEIFQNTWQETLCPKQWNAGIARVTFSSNVSWCVFYREDKLKTTGHHLTSKNARVPWPQLNSNKTAKKSYSQMCIQHTCNIIEEVNVDSLILHMIFNPF